MRNSHRGALVAAVVAAYLVGLWPSWALRDVVLEALGNPPYQGAWILFPHVFLYGTLQAVFCLVAWRLLARRGWMPAPRYALRWPAFRLGLFVGLVSIGFVVAFFVATGQASAFHAPRVDPWLAAANVASNLYEEYVYRGFILAALTAAFGFWPAAVLSSLAFAATHTQYPLALQALIVATALLWAWASQRDGLLAPYTAHMTADWVLDPIL